MVYLENLSIRLRSLLASRISFDSFSASLMNYLMFRKGFLLFFSFLMGSFFDLTSGLESTGPKRGSSTAGSVDLLEVAGMRNTSGSFFVIFGLG